MGHFFDLAGFWTVAPHLEEYWREIQKIMHLTQPLLKIPWTEEDVRRVLDVEGGGPVRLAGPALALEEVLPLKPRPVTVSSH